MARSELSYGDEVPWLTGHAGPFIEFETPRRGRQRHQYKIEPGFRAETPSAPPEKRLRRAAPRKKNPPHQRGNKSKGR